MHQRKTFFRVAAAACLLTTATTVLPAQAPPHITCGNASVQIDFDLTTGSYSVTDRGDNSVLVQEARLQVNEWSADPTYAFTANVRDITDDFGHGKKLHVEGAKTAAPTLLFEATIYDGKGFVALGVGIKNTSGGPLRVMKFQPLRGHAFPGGIFDDWKMLDGESGATLTHVSEAPALTSKNNLLVTFGKKGARKHSLVIGGLAYREFEKSVSVQRREGFLEIELSAEDPVGKLVPPGDTYVSPDRFYLDGTTDNRFEALEAYAAALRVANHVDLQGVNFPILNFWYAFVAKFGGDKFRDNSLGTIEEMGEIQKTGFLKYSPIGLRLEPDDYALPSNQQGWWDDAHWQKYKGGQLLPPFETIVKWGTKIREMGGIPFIYCQTAKRSEDYCVEHPDQMLFNTATAVRSKGVVGWWGREGDKTAVYWTYDFTDPGFIAHMHEVYRNLKAGGVQGIKFDYPDTGWAYDGGFEDKSATTTSAYRAIFQLAYNGLGPQRDVQERIPPFGDVALGVITTQRTEGDNDRVYPGRVAKTGLRWYKNRMVTNYDCDPINPFHVYPSGTRDGWRAAVTMTATTSGRLEIGKYFERMTPDMVQDLSRAVPLLPTPALSPRPIDAFSGVPYPQVYDFRIEANWHIVTFFNSHLESEEWPTDVMAYWTENKQFNPRKMVDATVGVSLGEKTDDGGLGLNPRKNYYVFDFWNWKFVGKIPGNSKLTQELRPGEARVMAVHEEASVPQFLSTSRHLLQGYLDFSAAPKWSPRRHELAGTSRLIAGETYRVIIAANGHKIRTATADGATCEIAGFDPGADLFELKLTSERTVPTSWRIAFEK